MANPTDPSSPQAAAVAWVSAVVERGDLAAAWPFTDPRLRLVLAQDWVWGHRHDPVLGPDPDREAIADGLAAVPSAHPLWDRFAADVAAVWAQTWKGYDQASWYVDARPEVLDLDLEMVTFVEDKTTLARRFALRHGPDGWQVAGVNGGQLFEPGWPPRLGRAAGPA